MANVQLTVVDGVVPSITVTIPGIQGPAGLGFPAGGTTGQALVKASNTDRDTVWADISKTTLGLGNVENTALSTWAGSASITTVGTLASGAVPWSVVTSRPTTLTGYGITDAAPIAAAVPTGGTSDQVLAKSGNGNYALTWADVSTLSHFLLMGA